MAPTLDLKCKLVSLRTLPPPGTEAAQKPPGPLGTLARSGVSNFCLSNPLPQHLTQDPVHSTHKRCTREAGQWLGGKTLAMQARGPGFRFPAPTDQLTTILTPVSGDLILYSVLQVCIAWTWCPDMNTCSTMIHIKYTQMNHFSKESNEIIMVMYPCELKRIFKIHFNGTAL